jgi:phthiodiolone/phenolphthiodiolone dimycocerosates ketoreductase
MCRITAKYAQGWLPFTLTVEEYKEKLNIIREECSRVGRGFDEIEKGVYLNLVIDESREECSKIMETPLVKAAALLAPASLYKKLGYKHPLGEDFYPLTDYVPAKYAKDEVTRAMENVPREVVEKASLWGNVADVIEKLDEYRKAGVQTVVFWNLTFLGDATKVKSSYSCIDQVVSHFKGEQ